MPQENIPLAPLTTFQIGGPARYYWPVTSVAELRTAITWARENNQTFYIIGDGTNLLVDDEGFDGLIIHMIGDNYTYDDTTVIAHAGSNLYRLILDSAQKGLTGWENMAGIPGTIGGAVRGNAGAFGTEMRDVVTRVLAIHSHTFEERIFNNAECEFGYRTSFFKCTPEWIVITVYLNLSHGSVEESQKKCVDTIRERESRQIQNVRSAGSFFMNPSAPQQVQDYFRAEKQVEPKEGRVPAGWLIQKVGLKGARVGGAASSEQHPNYLINASGMATCADVIELSRRIKVAVKKEFGIDLKEEVSMI